MTIQTINKIQVEANDTVSFLNDKGGGNVDYVHSLSRILPQVPTYLSYGLDTITIARAGEGAITFSIRNIFSVGGNTFVPLGFFSSTEDVQQRTYDIYKLLTTSIFKGCCDCGDGGALCGIAYRYWDNPSDPGAFIYNQFTNEISFSYTTANSQDFSGFWPLIASGSQIFLYSSTDPTNFLIVSLSSFVDHVTYCTFSTVELNENGYPFVDETIFCIDLASVGFVPMGVTSVGLSMPPAFVVSGSPVTSSGVITVSAAGLSSQYIRGDGTLANFPSSLGGGASVSYYLNGGTNQGTFGGITYYEMSPSAVTGTGVDFNINANGYIAQFLTNVGDPNQLVIPAGNWNFELFFSASSSGGTPNFYVELYKYNGTTFTLIASSVANPEGITNGTAIDTYFTALAVPQTTLLSTDRLAVRVYVNHSGRTITLHTQDSHLCQIVTTFTTGLTALNGLTAQVQSFANDTNVIINSAGSTHTLGWSGQLSAARGGTGLGSLGLPLQVLRVNSLGTALEYGAPGVTREEAIAYALIFG